MPYNTAICACTTQQYGAIIFDSVAYQNSANVVYSAKNNTVIAANNGTLGTKATGNPIFKSDYERMQFLLGKQSVPVNGVTCGVPPKKFYLGTN